MESGAGIRRGWRDQHRSKEDAPHSGPTEVESPMGSRRRASRQYIIITDFVSV
jgi:hypothetical protein